MSHYASDVAFTPAVKAIQAEKGSRGAYAKIEQGRGWQTTITPDLAKFVSGLDMFYLATANAAGQPYVQYRGGAPGLLKVLDDKTLGFADFGGNRQYITLGNLAENAKALIFLMDYAQGRRIKLWGTAHVIEGDSEVIDRVTEPGYPGRVERAILFTVDAWDVNCPQHIHRRFSQAQIASAVRALQSQIEELQAEIATLRPASE